MGMCTAELNTYSPDWNMAEPVTSTGSRVVSQIQ
jgi:hypothetical protein